ncbi:DNA polymerase IV [Salimicrobium halophilum]|uniref:DNA polymerase V n=1 Tax=Salimicrobium halophilum TaxID=86666 RepID=A0A1G8UNN3_9BACI|nr:DNA polymerase IV [Salimicrobium halophilum]SDJ55452.1 DNA polymerase V [Salimicrobium halophilum]
MEYDQYPRHDVLCLDMRSFYASVECIKRGLDPSRTLMAVVGDPERKGSIVLAASPALKKKHGISNVSRFFELPEDPEIIIAKASMQDYLDVSVEITKLIHQYAPMEAIHVYSVDELWVTVDGLTSLYGSPRAIAELFQKRIMDQFGIECAIGIGDNKFLAKVVLDIHAKKQKDGIAVCHYEDVERLLWPVPVEDIWGIGKRMMRRLNNMGIIKLGDLATHPLRFLKKRFGIMGEQLYWHSRGIDLSPVYGDFTRSEQKSFGHGITLLQDYEEKDIYPCILDLCEEVCRRARESYHVGRTVHIGIGYTKETGGGFSRSTSLHLPTNLTMDMYKAVVSLFHRHYEKNNSIRRVYVSLTNLEYDGALQLDFFDQREKQRQLSRAMDDIRGRHGSTSLLRASSYKRGGITLERSKKVGGHYA